MNSVVLFFLVFISFFCTSFISIEKNENPLEGVIVEKYYVNKKEYLGDTTGGLLPKGSVTYRIYVDMKPGYYLQALYGVPNHELKINTTTFFFNNTAIGAKTGDNVDDKNLNDNNTLSFDSWLTLSQATKSHCGVLKNEDRDGSLIKKKSFLKADGLVEGKVSKLINYGLDLNCFSRSANNSSFISNNGSLAVLGGIQGPTNENRVLVAQLTTNGKLSFELNVQIGTATGKYFQYVAQNPQNEEIQFSGLVQQ